MPEDPVGFERAAVDDHPSVQAMLVAFDEPALLTDHSHKVYAFNQRAQELLGLDPDTVGEPLETLLRNRDSPRDRGLDALIDLLPEITGEVILPVRINGRYGVFSGTWCVLPIGCPGPESWLLHRLYMREEEQDRSRVEFLANVSHELRTPLSALVATTEVMLQDYRSIPDAELGQMIGLLHRNTRRLEALVGNLLDASQLQNGKLQLRRSVCAAPSLLHEASDFVWPLMNSKNQTLKTTVGDDLPALFVDSKRIIGVLVNLLANASKYGLSNEPIELNVAREDRLVRFTVRQRGIGIPRHEQTMVFHRFYRASTGEQFSGGSGLGLAIVKEIVEMHGGSVGLYSVPEVTTAFWFTLPIERDLP